MEVASPFTHILVPVDGSEASINAGRTAIQIATMHNIPITFVYVVDSAIADEIVESISRPVESVRQELESKGWRYLEYLSRLARERNLRTDKVIRHGIPHGEISDLARERGVDLIVIGQVGRRGPRRALIGSVAERVIEYAPCSVLVVRYTSPRR